MRALTLPFVFITVALGALSLSGCAPHDTSVGGTQSQLTGGSCNPGESKPSEDGCNTCVCSSDGEGWACTDKACSGSNGSAGAGSGSGVGAGGASQVPPGTGAGGASQVPPGTGSGGATQVPPGTGAGGASQVPPGSGTGSGGASQVPPGTGAGGASQVPPGTGSGTGGASMVQCTPGEVQSEGDCTSCTCNADGTGWICIESPCSGAGGASPGDPGDPGSGGASQVPPDSGSGGASPVPPDSGAGGAAQAPCVPGDIKPAPDGCNTCVCSVDGTGWACTEKSCP